MNHATVAMTYNAIGEFYHNRKDDRQALTYLQKAKDIFLKIDDGESDNVPQIYYNIAWLYRQLGDNGKAIENGIDAYNRYVKMFGENSDIAKEVLDFINNMKGH